MARSRKSQTKVGLNSKLSAVDLLTISYDGAATFAEGAPITITAGQAAEAAAGDTVFVNFVDSARNDVIDAQGDAFSDLPAISIGDSGKLTGITGRNTLIGLPKECWDGGALPGAGDLVDIANGLFAGVASASVVAGDLYYGEVLYIADNRAWFLFSSTPGVRTIA